MTCVSNISPGDDARGSEYDNIITVPGINYGIEPTLTTVCSNMGCIWLDALICMVLLYSNVHRSIPHCSFSPYRQPHCFSCRLVQSTVTPQNNRFFFGRAPPCYPPPPNVFGVMPSLGGVPIISRTATCVCSWKCVHTEANITLIFPLYFSNDTLRINRRGASVIYNTCLFVYQPALWGMLQCHVGARQVNHKC